MSYIPKPGDHVVITNYDGFPPNEAVRLSKLPYLTVDTVLPLNIGTAGNYTTQYEISVLETNYCINFNYKPHQL